MAYGDGLENRSRFLASAGSNPAPSAILKLIWHNTRNTKAPIFRGLFNFANKLLTLQAMGTRPAVGIIEY